MANGFSPSDWRVSPSKVKREGNITYGEYRGRYQTRDEGPAELFWIVEPEDTGQIAAAAEAVAARYRGEDD
jgi:hypothetical protein